MLRLASQTRTNNSSKNHIQVIKFLNKLQLVLKATFFYLIWLIFTPASNHKRAEHSENFQLIERYEFFAEI